MSWGFNKTSQIAGFLSGMLPDGLIILLNDTSPPTGWDAFTDADGKFPVGAGSTYALDSTGGDATVAAGSVTLGSAGSHSSEAGVIDGSNAGGSGNSFGDVGGAHTHDANYSEQEVEPEYQQCMLIKSNGAMGGFPAKSAVLSASAIAGLTNIFTDGYLLKANTTVATGGGGSDTGTLSSEGQHGHNWSIRGPSGGGTNADDEGSHSTGSPTITFTPKAKRKLLSAWSHATSLYQVESNMIAMTDLAVPPAGWSLCDGSGGRPDLRDYFIELVATGNEDLSGTGTNTIEITCAAVTHGFAHDHAGAATQGSQYHQHAQYAWSHEHPTNTDTPAYLPPYYGLYFIIKD